ncbi:MAG: T9SS type A sorting domain-containing protein [Bacteroidota bacterium]
MKKINSLVFAIIFCVGFLSAQNYSHYTIRQVQEVSDSLLNLSKDISPKLASTVWVRGVVATPVRISDGRHLWYTGDRFRFMLKDPSTDAFNYISVVASDTAWFKTNVGIDLLVPGDSVEILGKITEYRTLTQLEVIKDANNTNVMILLGTSTAKIEPADRPLTDFFDIATGKTNKKNPAEKYESGFVKFKDLTVLDNVGAEFTVSDANGNKIRVDDQSNLIFGTTPPAPGSLLNFVQGYIFTNAALEWTINPRNKFDYQLSGSAPSIQTFFRSDTFPTPTSQINIRAKISSVGSSVSSATLFYAVNGVAKGNIEMTMGIVNDSTYLATIPATNLNDAVVSYYIVATNPQNYRSSSPADTIKEKYFYLTLNQPVTIKNIQFNPYGGGSSYSGARVTVSGIAVSDRRDYGAIFIQNGTGAWSGIRIRSSADSVVRRGQELSIYGLVRELSGLTVLDSSKITITNQSATLPLPTKVKASEILLGGNYAESFESVLLKLDSVYVVNLNEDSPSNQNFGEWGISEDKTKQLGLRVDDYSTKLPFTNDTTRSQGKGKKQLKVGDFFKSIVAPLDYSFSNFKLIPRDSADFEGYKPVLNVKLENGNIPIAFKLEANYPNPFNPSTTIRYSIISQSKVELKVYDLLGKEIAILVNEKQNPGTYSVKFESKNFATGIYLYQLKAGSFIQTNKMLLVK